MLVVVSGCNQLQGSSLLCMAMDESLLLLVAHGMWHCWPIMISARSLDAGLQLPASVLLSLSNQCIVYTVQLC